MNLHRSCIIWSLKMNLSIIFLVGFSLFGDNSEEATKARLLIKKNLIQEGIWIFEDLGLEDEAQTYKNSLLKDLENLPLSQTPGDIRLEGVSRPQLLVLPNGIKAVFKKKSKSLSAKYKSEILAYKLDQLLGLAIVPMTVERNFNGKIGSLQYFVKNAKTASQYPNYKRSIRLNILDYLVQNFDRHANNVLIAGGREIAIDHGMSARTYNIAGHLLRMRDKLAGKKIEPHRRMRQNRFKPKNQSKKFALEEKIRQKLEELSLNDFNNALYPYASKKQIRKIHKRAKHLLCHLKE